MCIVGLKITNRTIYANSVRLMAHIGSLQNSQKNSPIVSWCVHGVVVYRTLWVRISFSSNQRHIILTIFPQLISSSPHSSQPSSGTPMIITTEVFEWLLLLFGFFAFFFFFRFRFMSAHEIECVQFCIKLPNGKTNQDQRSLRYYFFSLSILLFYCFRSYLLWAVSLRFEIFAKFYLPHFIFVFTAIAIFAVLLFDPIDFFRFSRFTAFVVKMMQGEND